MAVEMAALPAADALDEGDIIGIVQVAPQAGDETIVCATCVLQKPKESAIELNKGKDCAQTFRCRDCHRCMGRMQFVKQHKGVGDFGVVGKQKKIEWFQKKHALIGDDLAASMQDTIKLTISEKSSEEFKGTSQYMSEVELLEHFKKEPSRAKSIMKNARPIQDGDGEVQLWPVTVFSEVKSRKNEAERTRTLSVSQEHDAKKRKTTQHAKVKKEKSNGVDPEHTDDGSHAVTQKQKERLQSMSTDLNEKMQVLGEDIKIMRDGKMKGMVPEFYILKADMLKGDTNLFMAELTLWIDEMKITSTFKEVLATYTEKKTSANTLMNKLTRMIENAVEDLDLEIVKSEDGEQILAALGG